MRIGIDCRLWNESGVGRYIKNLISNLYVLDDKNEYVLFVLSKDYEEINSQLSTLNFQLIKTDIRWHSIKEQLKFPSVINRENLDLMHFPYSSVPIFYNKLFVVTIHDLIPFHFPTGEASTLPLPLYRLKLLGYKLVISQATKKAKKIIAVSNSTKEEIVKHLKIDSDKVVVIYEGVGRAIPNKYQNPKYNPSASLRARIPNTKYFLYVGNAYPHKNLDRLIEAFDLFCHPEILHFVQNDNRSTQNDMKLVLVGRDDYFYKRLKEKVKDMGLEKSVKFLGEVSDEELVSLYRNAKALVMPSLMEGFGLTALEAMANKCLVLASDIPSLREICGNSVIYFDPYSIDDMYHKMKEIYFNDINPSVGEAGHYSDNIRKGFDHVRRGFERSKMFSWQKMSKETLEIYESCVGVR